MSSPSLGFRGCFGASVFLLLSFGAASVRAQQKPVLVRPEDALNRDAKRPDMNESDVRIAQAASASEVEAALKDAQKAFEAKPPRYSEAEASYLRAAKANPKEARAYMGLGNVYAAQNRAEDAIKALQKAIELKPKLAGAHFNLGMICSALGKRDEALKEYQTLQLIDRTLAEKLKQMIER